MTSTARRTIFVAARSAEPFWEPRTARITCRVCGARAEQSIHTPALLCLACLIDLDHTAAHVAYVRDSTLGRLSAASNAWQGVLSALDATSRHRWEAVTAAREQLPAATFQARWERTKAAGGAFAAVLAAYEANAAVADTSAAQLAWCDEAAAEIAAAREEQT